MTCRAAVAVGLAAALAGGCSSYRSEPEAPADDVECRPVGYPPCPYGTAVGDVVSDAKFVGFATSKSTSTAEVRLRDFYDPTGATGKKLLFVNVGALWCGPCREETAEMPAVFEHLHDRVAFLQIVFEGAQPSTPSTERDLRNWDDAYELPFWTVLDPDNEITKYFNRATPPFSMVVDVATMKIVAASPGKPDDLEAFIASHL